MTEIEQIELVRDITKSKISDSLISAYLEDAKEAIQRRLYPFEADKPVPDGYKRLQCKLASRYILRRGAEGEKAHNEDGVNRTYGSVNDADLLDELTPCVFVP